MRVVVGVGAGEEEVGGTGGDGGREGVEEVTAKTKAEGANHAEGKPVTVSGFRSTPWRRVEVKRSSPPEDLSRITAPTL